MTRAEDDAPLAGHTAWPRRRCGTGIMRKQSIGVVTFHPTPRLASLRSCSYHTQAGTSYIASLTRTHHTQRHRHAGRAGIRSPALPHALRTHSYRAANNFPRLRCAIASHHLVPRVTFARRRPLLPPDSARSVLPSSSPFPPPLARPCSRAALGLHSGCTRAATWSAGAVSCDRDSGPRGAYFRVRSGARKEWRQWKRGFR